MELESKWELPQLTGIDDVLPGCSDERQFFFFQARVFSGCTATHPTGPAVQLASSDGFCAKEHLPTLTDGFWSSRRSRAVRLPGAWGSTRIYYCELNTMRSLY